MKRRAPHNPVESLALRLERRGFCPLLIRPSGTHAPWGDQGIVAVAKPGALDPGCNTPRLGACLLLSPAEEAWIRQMREGRGARLDTLAGAVERALS